MGKKKFIDKKKSATYQLIARDTSDPNYNQGPSGDTVFVRIDENPCSFESFNEDAAPDSDSIFGDAPDDNEDEDESGGSGRQVQPSFMPNGTPAVPDNIRKEIIELGFPDDGYNYLAHMREIKNTGAGSVYYENPKAKLDQMQNDVKAYDASRIEISKVSSEPYEKSIYSVASMTAGARIQKVVDPEVAALLDDSDSRFGSDVEDLEEDFVFSANLPEEETEAEFYKQQNVVDGLVVNRIETSELKASDLQENIMTQSFVGEGKKFIQGGGDKISEKPRVRRLLDEQFDMLEIQEYGSDGTDEYGGFMDDEEEYHEPLAEKLNHSIKYPVKDDLGLEEKYTAPSDLLQGDKTVNDAESPEGAAKVIRRCMEYAEKYENELTDEEVVVLEESSDESEIWDCETIVTTYSNLDNHPGKIGVPEFRRKKKLAETFAGALSAPSNIISLKGKQMLPVEFLPGSKKPAKEKVKDDGNVKTETELYKRKQHGQESKEEKKERKVMWQHFL
ncbi:hypothetical protein AgCh_010327 [Apium graveolens]